MIGGGDYATGVFGMDFSQPSYQFPAGSFQLDITFEFKKSVFFTDFAVICLGSGITTTMSSPNITQVHLIVSLSIKHQVESFSQILKFFIACL